MTSEDLRAFLIETGISQADFARLVGVTSRAVALWLAGARDIPGPADAYARVFRQLSPSLRQQELNRLKERGSGMRDGMYGISFQGEQGVGEGMLIFDGGRVYGTDRGGARYDGEYLYSENTGQAEMTLKVTFPPGGESVFGIANPYEWSIDVKASLDPKQDSGQLAVKTSLGQLLNAQYQFLRALPDGG